ncbi:YgjP-like metallopeptidase domain-containing protein [Helicobacter burdigaliensis]|uniref:YgjP-like metallopeptidase domain-containing protein n=1 Tax=Helicobacter burdigaliensis TaxID=2315334 RepID=UPI000EF6DE67|nr:YgjP-like metallopeptidase domain-containing protein [Helicobacter burdigaliensis]
MILENFTLKIIKSKNYKSLRLHLKSPTFLHLSAPKYTSKKECLNFILQNEEWIKEQSSLLLSKKEGFKKELLKNKIYLFGEWIDFDNLQEKNLQEIWQDFIFHQETKILKKFYSTQLKLYIAKSLETLSARLELFPAKISYTSATKTLGSCTKATQSLRFSYRLVFLKKHIIDKIIIHELAHLKFPHHKEEFWNFVRKFDNNPKEIHSYLSCNPFSLSLFLEVFKA